MSKKIICFYPSIKKGTNHFLYNLAKLLEDSGDFDCWDYKEIKKKQSKKIFQADVFHFNWYDQSLTLFSFFKRFYFLIALKIKNKEIIWTIHNIKPHVGAPKYNWILRHLLVLFSSKIHIMNSASANIPYLRQVKSKVIQIPHGDYFYSYPESDVNIFDRYNISPTKKIILFIGAIMPYKNIDVLIEAHKSAFLNTKESPVLLICGKTEPAAYREKITNLIDKNKNIIYDPKFVLDKELAAYLKQASILVAPYSYDSSLNSGTIPLAFSYGKTVICPDIACVKDIQEESDCLYSYHYNNSNQHKEELSKALVSFYNDAVLLQRKEEAAKLYMKKNSWVAHREEWISLYKGVRC